MLNNTDKFVDEIRKLGLSKDEARVYIELLKSDDNHMGLSRKTGVNRTKVYRIADDLEKRSLISRKTDDRGTFLTASDPRTLETEIVAREEKIKSQTDTLKELLPELDKLKILEKSPFHFEVHTYDGIEGMKQMLWHELKTKDEALVFCSGPMEDLVPDKKWCDRHRMKTIQADYVVRDLVTADKSEAPDFTDVDQFYDLYESRSISPDELDVEHQVVIYNDTVAIYAADGDKRVGTEIINSTHADMFRQIFEKYWESATPQPKPTSKNQSSQPLSWVFDLPYDLFDRLMHMISLCLVIRISMRISEISIVVVKVFSSNSLE